MAKQPIPAHPEGWKFVGACGNYRVWHAGKNDYRVTQPFDDAVVARYSQFNPAFTKAGHLHKVEKLSFDRWVEQQEELYAEGLRDLYAV